MLKANNRITIRHENIGDFVKLQDWLFARGVRFGHGRGSRHISSNFSSNGIVVNGMLAYINPMNFNNEAPNEAIFKIKVLKALKVLKAGNCKSE